MIVKTKTILLKLVPLILNSLQKIVFRKIRLYLASKIDSKLQKCPTFGGSLQNPAAFNQKGYYTKITHYDSVYLGFDAEVPQKIIQGLYFRRHTTKVSVA